MPLPWSVFVWTSLYSQTFASNGSFCNIDLNHGPICHYLRVHFWSTFLKCKSLINCLALALQTLTYKTLHIMTFVKRTPFHIARTSCGPRNFQALFAYWPLWSGWTPLVKVDTNQSWTEALTNSAFDLCDANILFFTCRWTLLFVTVMSTYIQMGEA